MSGELATPGFTNCARVALPPLWPNLVAVRTTVDGAAAFPAFEAMFAAPWSTAAPAACASASGAVRLTFGAGLAGFGVITDATVANSRLAPVSIMSSDPAATPVVDESRTADAPAAAAWFSVVATGATTAADLRWYPVVRFGSGTSCVMFGYSIAMFSNAL